MSTDQAAALNDLLTPVLAEQGYELEAVELLRAGNKQLIRVLIDHILTEDAPLHQGITLDEIAEQSRKVSEVLDASPLLADHPYVLEVSSPGVTRPMREPRQWRRSHGRLVTIDLTDGTRLEARVLRQTGDGLTVATGESQRTLDWSEVRKGRVQVEFTKPESGADSSLSGEE